MKHLLLASAAVALVACSGGEAPDLKSATEGAVKSAAAMVDTKTKAVLVYADWCGSCKVLDPAIEKARAMGDVPGVEFVVLDYTDKDADAFFAAADEAGVGEAVREALADGVKTGQLLLVDVDDQRLVGKVTKEDAAPAIIAKIKDAVAQS